MMTYLASRRPARARAGRSLALLAALLVSAGGFIPWAWSAPPPTVLWQLPVAHRHPAQTPAQKLSGKQEGRDLPTPDILQPTLDPRLTVYQPRYSEALSGTIRIESSDILPRLVHSWIRAFARFYPHVRIQFGPPYEGSHAAQDLIAGKITIAMVSRELKPTDVSQFTARYGYAPTSVPVSGGSYRQFGFLDAVTVIVNQANPVKQLSKRQLDAIFSSSHLRGDVPVRRWGQLGATGAWKDRPVHVYAIKPWNGFEEFFRQRVLDARGKRGHWRHDIHLAPTVFPIAGQVAADPDAIAYTGLAFVDAPVKVIAVGNGDTAVSPTYANVASARYPLSRLIYANVNRKPGRPLPTDVAEFLRFILSRQGQAAVRHEGIFLPLRAGQVQAARQVEGPPDRSKSS
ncbi:substrate-binding domain-containing protein [Oleiagrimonas sp.]|jgi:phosphate transport system substrate-binding protein|uniref:PstS family phosphate ABC transporter substrate-binding protein n=1 Tax=Oleiagrimonas sp. TaxID=2010330 RepID=UPI00261A918D|nr:substrate-binding domain-containing protein [Oleiagrimonas sp.]MDA3912879.1 substrate-binding domain-containing protein [Oleiagrimonas sp.]